VQWVYIARAKNPRQCSEEFGICHITIKKLHLKIQVFPAEDKGMKSLSFFVKVGVTIKTDAERSSA